MGSLTKADIPGIFNTTAALTAAYTVVAADRGKLFDCTSGTFTITLTAAATLGAGFSFAVRNSGTGVITLDPDAAELVDGVATITYAEGVSSLVTCNGTAFKTVGLTRVEIFTKKFTSAAQVITSAGLLTLAHGMGLVPRNIQMYLVCLVAEHGYAVGDRLMVQGTVSGSAADNYGVSVVVDVTNLVIRYGGNATVWVILTKGAGAGVLAVNASWSFNIEVVA